MLKIEEKFRQLVNWGLRVYDHLMMLALHIRWMRTYYGETRSIGKQRIARQLRLTDEEFERGLKEGFQSVADKEVFARFVTRRIRLRAGLSALMTFLCTLPQNWVIWPLMVVDIVFFQRQVFLLAQELKILYGCVDSDFDYMSLSVVSSKMEGLTNTEKLFGYAKRAVGKGVRMGLSYGSRVFRVALRSLVAQGAKWVGIRLSHNMIDVAIEMATVLATSLVAGLVSYWLFVPMARRLERLLKSD